MKSCISETKIVALISGTLSAAESKKHAKHLRLCRNCRNRMQRLHLVKVAMDHAKADSTGTLKIDVPRPSPEEKRAIRKAVLNAFDQEKKISEARVGLVREIIARIRVAFESPMEDAAFLGYAATAPEDDQSETQPLFDEFATCLERLLGVLLDERIPLATRMQLLKRMERLTWNTEQRMSCRTKPQAGRRRKFSRSKVD